mgnify:CR=1 FL=1|tara:strand:+ start:582 stop:809 length:228 start_codon:yes stop_codon:yes gene_type:complete
MSTEHMQAMASALNEALNGSGEKKNGFVLLVFPFEGPKGQRTNYVSNGKREDIVTALKEIVGRFEGRTHGAPTEQ